MHNRRPNYYLGAYPSLAEVWRHFPRGGHSGECLSVAGRMLCWDAASANWLAPHDNDAFRSLHLDGDLRLMGDLMVGGKTLLRHSTVCKGDVTIEGTLTCCHLRGMDRGLYATADALRQGVPRPRRGEWALVGSNATLQLWSCATDGQWQMAAESVNLADAFNLDAYDQAKAVVDDIASQGYVFCGMATPDMLPHEPVDHNVFYLTSTPGRYLHFGEVEVTYFSALMWTHDAPTGSPHRQGRWTACVVLGGVFVYGANIAEGAVATAHLADGAVTMEKMADGAVTLEKTTGIVPLLDQLRGMMVKGIDVNSGAVCYPDQDGIVHLTVAGGGEGGGGDQEALAALAARVDSLEPRTTVLEGKAQSLESSTAGLAVRATSLETTATALEATTTALETTTSLLRRDVDSLMTGGEDLSDWNVITADAAIVSATFHAGGKYRILSTLTMSADYTMPADVSLFIDGGKIDGSGVTLTGNHTRIIDTTKQIFGVGVSCEGTWDIPFARPEWWGAKADAVDYGSWPLRVYGGTVTAQQIAGHVVDGLPENYETVYPHDPEVYFNMEVYPYASDAGIMPEYIPFQVKLDTTNMRFLFELSVNGVTTYYTQWLNSHEWNDESATSHVRTDAVFVSSEEGFSDDPTMTSEGVKYPRTTKAHVFERGNDGTLSYPASKVRLGDTNAGHDATIPFKRAFEMLNGRMTLQKNGVYQFKSQVRDATNVDTYFAVTGKPEGVLEGNNATLYLFPYSYDIINAQTHVASQHVKSRGISIQTSVDPDTSYTMRDIRVTTVKAFKGIPYSQNLSGTVRRGDLACSRLNCFEIHQVTGIVLDGVYTTNFMTAMYVHQGRSSSLFGDSCAIRRWKSVDDYLPLHYNIGTCLLEVEDSDIRLRKYGDPESHIFYLELHGLNQRMRFVCRRTKIYQADGYVTAPFNITGDNSTEANLWAQKPKHTVEFDHCQIYAIRWGTCTMGLNLLIRDTDFKANGASAAAMDLQTAAPATTFIASATGITRITIERSNLQLGALLMLQNVSEKKGCWLTMSDSRVESTFNKSAHDDLAHTEFAEGAFIRTWGTVEMRHCVLLIPYAPAFGLPPSKSSATSNGKAKKFIAEDNVVVCAGYFLATFNPEWLTKTVIDNNQLTIDRLNVDWRWKSTVWRTAACVLAAYDTRTSESGDGLASLAGVTLTDNTVVSADSSYPATLTRGVVETGYDRLSGNTIDGMEYPGE